MEVDQTDASPGDDSDCSGDVVAHKNEEEVKTRHFQRLLKLKAHHNVCEDRYEKANIMLLNKEKERTISLQQRMKTMTEDEIKVPPLKRTESVFLTKEMLQVDSDDLPFTPYVSDNSEDEYILGSSTEESSDQLSEDTSHPPRAKKRRLGEDSKQQKIQAGKSSRAPDEPEPSQQQLEDVKHSGGTKKAKRHWSTQEVKAVEKSLKDFIRTGKTPGKKECEKCLAASPEALAERDWRAIKFYVHNRIVTEKRM